MQEIGRIGFIPAFEFDTEIPLMTKTQFGGDLFDRAPFPKPMSCCYRAQLSEPMPRWNTKGSRDYASERSFAQVEFVRQSGGTEFHLANQAADFRAVCALGGAIPPEAVLKPKAFSRFRCFSVCHGLSTSRHVSGALSLRRTHGISTSGASGWRKSIQSTPRKKCGMRIECQMTKSAFCSNAL